MSTAPSGFQTPKNNWQPADVVQASDLNRIEGNINAIEQGARTLDQAQAPSGNEGSLRQILSWLANRIRAILGTTNWFDAPPITLQSTKAHTEAGAAHGATSQAVAAKIIARDAYGRAKVAAPSAADDIARLDSVTKAQVGLGNVTNDAQMPIAGGTFTGIAKAQSNTSYTTGQVRNIFVSASDPASGDGGNGDVWLKYK